MSYPKDLREKLCMAQRPFAILIGCPESQLFMAETGQRSLPSSCDQLLAALEGAAAQMGDANSNQPPNTALTIKWLKRQIRNHEARRQVLLLEKEKLDRQVQQCQQWLQAAAALEGNALGQTASKHSHAGCCHCPRRGTA
jgi:hypothetical protein